MKGRGCTLPTSCIQRLPSLEFEGRSWYLCGGAGCGWCWCGGGVVIPEEVTLRLAPDPAFVRLASREGFDISSDVSAVTLPPTEAIR